MNRRLCCGGVTKYGRAGPNGQPTHGGYSDAMVVNERFAFKVPDDADLAKEGTSGPVRSIPFIVQSTRCRSADV